MASTSMIKSSSNLLLPTSISDSSPRLPAELVDEIFFYLPPSDYGAARMVCRLWYQASLRKSLLRSLLFKMEFNPFNSSCPCFVRPRSYWSEPQASICLETCPCNYKFPDEPISTWDLEALRTALALALDRWPSTVRVSCGKLAVDMSALLGDYNTDWGYSESLREIESICFSGSSGSFVGTVTRAIGGRDGAERKLWIHRLFTSKYSPSNNFARPNASFMYSVEGSRYLPGQLYMTMELTNFPGLPVVGLQIEEHLAFSAVKKIVISYANNSEEEITFDKFKPDRQPLVRGSSDGAMVFYDRNGITYRSHQLSKDPNPRSRPGWSRKEKSNIWESSIPWRKYLARRAEEVVIHAGPPKRTSPAIIRISQRLLATIGDESLHQMCYRVTVPLPPLSGEGGYCSVIVTPESNIFVCAPSIDSPGSAEKLHAQYKFSVPVRASEIVRPRITHLTVAPQYFHDFARGVWWMAICAAYDNGEIWLWQIDTEAFLRERDLSDAPTHNTGDLSLPKAPEKSHILPGHPKSTVCQAYESSSQPNMNHNICHPRSGDFDVELGKCVSANLHSFSGHALGGNGSSPTEKVRVLLPTAAGENDGFQYARACKLGYMPGLEALNFVGQGRTVLAATKKEIVAWDMRLWRGLQRGKLKVEF